MASSGPASSLLSSGSLQLRMCVGPSRRTPASPCRSPVASVLDWMRSRRGLQFSQRFQCSHGLCFDVELSRPASFITASLADHSDFRVYTRSCTGRFPSSCASLTSFACTALAGHGLQGECHCSCLSIQEQERI